MGLPRCVDVAAASAPPAPARREAADHEIVAVVLNVSALDQSVSGCFKVVFINCSENTTLFIGSVFLHTSESQSRPSCANTSVAIHRDISQGGQPKIPRDVNLG